MTTVDFGSSPDKVWGLLTDNENYSWRSDLAEIKIGEKAADFTEVGKDGTEAFYCRAAQE